MRDFQMQRNGPAYLNGSPTQDDEVKTENGWDYSKLGRFKLTPFSSEAKSVFLYFVSLQVLRIS